MIEDFSYANSLLFYTMLKALTQSKMSDKALNKLQKSLQECGKEYESNDVDKVKNNILNLQILNKKVIEYSNIASMVDKMNRKNVIMWFDLVDTAIDLLLVKDSIIQESKIRADIERNDILSSISDKLSMEYDEANLEIPYGQRVICAMLCSELTDAERRTPFSIKGLEDKINKIDEKLKHIQKEYKVSTDDVFMLIVNESVNQSIISDAGSSYEARVSESFEPIFGSLTTHTHDSNMQAVEYDFTFNVDNKTIGISAKRTLRERYKQNIDNTELLDVDLLMIVTLGTDLNEAKLDAIMQRNVVVVVAHEIYESADYLKENERVISSSNLSKDMLDKFF